MVVGCRVILMSLILSLFGSCINPYKAVVEQVDPRGWSGTDTLSLEYNNVDTLSFLKLSVILRTNKRYSHEGLVLTVITSDSTKREEIDHLYIENIPHKRGLSRYSNVVIPFRDLVKLGRGDYQFRISHNKGVVMSMQSVGIEVVESK